MAKQNPRTPVTFPFELSSEDGQKMLAGWSNIYPAGSKPRFNEVVWGGVPQICTVQYSSLIEMHPVPNSTSTCEFDLPEGAVRIACGFGMGRQNNNPGAKGDFTGTIEVDGRQIWSNTVKGDTCAMNIFDINVPFGGSGPFFKLIFKVNSNGSNGADHAIWTNPMVYNV